MIGGWEAVGYGLELEIFQALEGIRAPRVEETTVVEVGVDEGDVKGMGVKEFGELEHGTYVALGWVWKKHCVRLPSL